MHTTRQRTSLHSKSPKRTDVQRAGRFTTITDPDALTIPYTTSRTLRRHRDWTLAEYICEENNRNSVDQSGKARINLAPPQQK